MNRLVPWIQFAGLIHLAVIGANFVLPKKLNVHGNLARVSPIIRQVFLVHWLYIVIVLGLFAALCLVFPQELAGGSTLGRFFSGFLCAFWSLRIVLQLLVYDASVRRANRLLDSAYLLALGYLAAVFGIAAWGGLQ